MSARTLRFFARSRDWRVHRNEVWQPATHLHARAPVTACGLVSPAHWTLSVPPPLEVEQVAVQVTVHFAFEPQLNVEPAPIVAVQVLPEAQSTVADAPAVSEHVDWLEHERFALSPAAMVQLLCELHCVLQDAPQLPLQFAPEVQFSVQPLVVAPQLPPAFRSQAPAAEHEHLVPVHVAGAYVGPESEEHAPTTPARRAKVNSTPLVIGGA